LRGEMVLRIPDMNRLGLVGRIKVCRSLNRKIPLGSTSALFPVACAQLPRRIDGMRAFNHESIVISLKRIPMIPDDGFGSKHIKRK